MKERDILLAMKEKEHKEKGLPFDGNFYVWDYRYYDRKFVENSLHLDDMEVKEYFPVSVVIPAILSIYQSLLGVRFEEIKTSTWHPGLSSLRKPFLKLMMNSKRCKLLPFGIETPRTRLALKAIAILTSIRVVCRILFSC